MCSEHSDLWSEAWDSFCKNKATEKLRGTFTKIQERELSKVAGEKYEPGLDTDAGREGLLQLIDQRATVLKPESTADQDELQVVFKIKELKRHCDRGCGHLRATGTRQ